VEGAIESDKDARAAYEKFGPSAKSIHELNAQVDAELEKKWGKGNVEIAGTTDSSGNITTKHDPNPYTAKATRLHEESHKQDTLNAIKAYGKGTPEFTGWYFSPKRYASGEVKAYSVEIRYLEGVLSKMNAPQ
jgi:hypothetical protein